ncbi:hypothetical protein FB451DRAFT_1181462 [Mycena latifolia]|nr:hypothetical protein FB451DRAFT_1181462 [Mycena latifolia]
MEDLFRPQLKRNFTHGIFAQITHLALFDSLRPVDLATWSELTLIPHLSPLSCISESFLPLCGTVLRTCNSLPTLVVLNIHLASKLDTSPLVLEKTVLVRDHRLVFMNCVYCVKDWQKGAHTGIDYWSRAEDFIEKRRSEKVDPIINRAIEYSLARNVQDYTDLRGNRSVLSVVLFQRIRRLYVGMYNCIRASMGAWKARNRYYVGVGAHGRLSTEIGQEVPPSFYLHQTPLDSSPWSFPVNIPGAALGAAFHLCQEMDRSPDDWLEQSIDFCNISNIQAFRTSVASKSQPGAPTSRGSEVLASVPAQRCSGWFSG